MERFTGRTRSALAQCRDSLGRLGRQWHDKQEYDEGYNIRKAVRKLVNFR